MAHRNTRTTPEQPATGYPVHRSARTREWTTYNGDLSTIKGSEDPYDGLEWPKMADCQNIVRGPKGAKETVKPVGTM